MDSCIFCKIGKGEIPSLKVFEDENFLAFLDIRPIKKGHTLLIPKKHTDYLFDMSDEELASITLTAKKVSGLLKKAFSPKSGKVGVIVYGLDVPHAHIHLVPIDKTGDLSFSNATPTPIEKLQKILEEVKNA